MVAALICLVLGLAWLFSVANVFYRDVEHLLAVVFLPWFFLTPVLYGLEQFSAASSHRWLILLMRYGNPVTPYVEGVRAVVLQATVPGAPLLHLHLPRRPARRAARPLGDAALRGPHRDRALR